MFNLSATDLDLNILGCGDGPASFNVEMTALGHPIISIDPIYAFSAAQIASRVADTYATIVDQMKQNADQYVWDFFADADAVGCVRLTAMHKFLDDFEPGLVAGRYCVEALPSLPFADQHFGLALCSHLLFLYSEQLSLAFHLASVRELCRVAKGVRIFPLLALNCNLSSHVEPVRMQLVNDGYRVALIDVAHEFQRGGKQMMRIYKGAASHGKVTTN